MDNTHFFNISELYLHIREIENSKEYHNKLLGYDRKQGEFGKKSGIF